ncbi:intraflagellar transport protein 43 homolog A [Lutzomyia longipalpis]|uniref:intraflagellar transport protein 43 homolog A n=1 Tax=Lutzomyia longipalpis TaxID=7200 RepID=UPI002483F00A|nr:intraflagellar transport protein 43 homolog A [Lutzomyia longipalpis]
MDWDLKSVLKSKASVKKGRRSNAEGSSKKEESSKKDETTSSPLTEEKDSILGNDFDMPSLDGPPQRARKIGGWAEETQKSGKNRTAINLIEQERFQQSTNPTDNVEDEIPTIPDLDDMQDDILLNDIAPSHSISVKMAATYKALNSDMAKLSNLASLEDVDLSLLTKCLQNESTEEVDEPWYWEELFTSVSAEINSTKSSGKAISPFLH